MVGVLHGNAFEIFKWPIKFLSLKLGAYRNRIIQQDLCWMQYPHILLFCSSVNNGEAVFRSSLT